jgi:heme A synthase
MYTTVLTIHSWVRWLALIAAVGATFAAVRGKVQGTDSLADRWGLFAMMAVDIQMLLGLILYLVVSPNMQEIRAHFGEAMKNAQLRFWAVEHISAMFAALVLVHVGRVLARKARTPVGKRTRLLICFGLATVLMILGTPWPGMPAGRPLFRL